MNTEKPHDEETVASDADERFERIADSFACDHAVTRGINRGFCSGALKVHGKVFAFISAKGEYIVKLPRDRVASMVATQQGQPFNPGHGRIMREWIAIARDSPSWLDYAREARCFVGGSGSDEER